MTGILAEANAHIIFIFITSTKEVMFSSASVYLLVSRIAQRLLSAL